MKLSHGSCQQLSRSLFPMAFSCWCYGRMKGQSGPFDEHTDNSQHHYVPQPFLSEGGGLVAASWRYGVVTDEELIEGLSFSAYRRVSTAIVVPAPSGSAVEMVTIDPLDLQAAQELDAKIPNAEPAAARKL